MSWPNAPSAGDAVRHRPAGCPIAKPFGLVLALAGVTAVLAAPPDAQAPPVRENRWEASIRRFEAQDRQKPPPKHGVLFVGSSSVVGWDLPRCFPGVPVVNRGFGGSYLADSTCFAERIVLPCEPKVIVLYAGDNDIAAGKGPEQVLSDYRQFVAKVHRALPETRILFISIKPSIARWKLVDRMREANRLILAETKKDKRLLFVDVDQPMIGADGKPRAALFKEDGLHLNAEGYRLWSELVRPHLEEAGFQSTLVTPGMAIG